MALIKCPECGKEVSTNAKMCPHCGSEITYCPDCGGVFAGNLQSCPNCGNQFNKPIAQDVEETKENRRNKIFREWCDRSDKMDTVATIMLFSLALIEVVLVIISAVKYWKWSDLEVLDRAFSFNATFEDIKVYVVIICIINALTGIDKFEFGAFTVENIYRTIFAHWMKENNIDAKEYVRDYLSGAKSDKSAMTKEEKQARSDYAFVARSQFYKDNPNEVRNFYICFAVRLVLLIIMTALVGSAIIQNLEIFMLSDAKGEKGFPALNYPIIIAAIAFIVILFVFNKIVDSKRRAKYQQWEDKEISSVKAEQATATNSV